MKKLLLLFIVVFLTQQMFSVPWKSNRRKLTEKEIYVLFDLAAPTSFSKVIPSDIMSERSYIDLAREGWTVGEIVRLTDEYYNAHKLQLKEAGSSIDYTKFWRPYYVSTNLMDATILDYINPQELQKSKDQVLSTQVDPNAYYPRIFYNVNDRLSGIRNTGYFRHNACMPSGGRIHWIAVNPDDPNKVMVIPDSEGIWRTDDLVHWDCITERIPNRYDRNASDAYSIPVDPDDWNHIFAFMANNTVYETKDGGQTWRKITGAQHKGFKRGYCFRDASGGLKFIGAKPVGENGIAAQLWISGDTCKNWTSIVANSLQKDIVQTTSSGSVVSTFWFQEIAFHPTNRNTLYAAGSRRILRSTDAGKTWSSMTFKVYGATTGVVRAESTDLFPLATANTPMFLAVNPSNGDEMWAALSTRSNAGYSALYKTTDGGATWITLQEPSAGIGSGGVFGNESAWNWLGGFTVNFANPNYVFGCSMSSAESSNGGVNFIEKSWVDRSTGIYPDGKIYSMSVASHNADNHVLKGHKSGRVYRGGDAGLIMKDPSINNNNWTNVSGDMGDMMFYTAATNEFGDFSITGNTQDINIQTYRGGRWGMSRGYEGSTIWMNPFSGEEHFPYLTSGGTAIQNQDYGSWSRAWTQADVCTGNWYIRREGTNPDGSRFSVIKNFGKSSIGLDNSATGWVQDFALSRDIPGGKLFIIRGSKLYVSTNSGTSFTPVNMSGLTATKVAVNPTNSNEIYLAKDGAVYLTTNGGASWSTISTAALTGVSVKSFYYHEGSGDLYFVSAVHGIFIRESGSTDWVLWSKGYNTAKLTDAQINYTTQEMIINDYGSGIWIADLQHPSDRYLKNGFALKQLSNINNNRTFGIDVHYTIPMYYHYKWFVNNVEQVAEKCQYFTTSTLMPDDVVRLEVTLRESPDITTKSAEFIVPTQNTEFKVDNRGNYLYSNQKGRLDLGYVDNFYGNFSIQMWVNPKSDGVILANRQVNTNAVKGFYIALVGGNIIFNYTPEVNFEQPYNETTKTKHYQLNGGTLALNTWSQITVTHNRYGNIQIYVNGVLKATQARAFQEFTLNNSLYLSMFADGYELNPIEASVDELKIWSDVLDQITIRKSMYGAIQPSYAKLIYYNDFNAATLDAQRERFSQKGMAPKMDAVVSVNESALGICASANEYKSLVSSWTAFFANSEMKMEIKSNLSSFTPNVLGLVYNGMFLGTQTNLPQLYFDVYPEAFGIKMFDVSDFTSTLDLRFYLNPAQAATFSDARIYVLDLNANSELWVPLSTVPVYNSVEKTLTLSGIKASEVNNKQLVIVKVKPSIDLTSAFFSSTTDLQVYSPDTVKIPLSATLMGGLSVPAGNYSLLSNSLLVKSIQPLSFVGNTATSTAAVLLDDNGKFDEKASVQITGQDLTLKPLGFTAINKITPKTIQNGVKMNLGGASVGSASNFSALNAKNTATYMAWVRLDDATMLTGYKMLLFFRGGTSSATGIALNNGKVGCHWNDESWSWDVNSGLTLTNADLGKWVHIAMTVSPSGLNFYLNGKKGNAVGNGISNAAIGSPLMLGKNNPTDAVFIGAFDQVALWNRTLSQAEIVKYMHSRVYLNDEGLITYLTLDTADPGGNYYDLKSNALVTFNGVVNVNQISNIPFNFAAQQARTRGANNSVIQDGISFDLPTTYPASYVYYTSSFQGVPYNAVDIKYPKQVLLENCYRTISFATLRTFTSTEVVKLIVQNSNIQAGDSVIFYARPLGSLDFFPTRYSTLATDGEASFNISGKEFNQNLTYLFYRSPKTNTSVNRPNVYKYKMTIDNGQCSIHNLRGAAQINVHNLEGKVVFQQYTSDSYVHFSLPQGTYIVHIVEYGIPSLVKIII